MSKRKQPAKNVAAPLRQSQKDDKNPTISGSLGPADTTSALAGDIGKMIEDARHDVARTANAALSLLYWRIGSRIRQDILKEQRAEYGSKVVAALGRTLAAKFGRGFGEKNLRRMVQFAESFPTV